MASPLKPNLSFLLFSIFISLIASSPISPKPFFHPLDPLSPSEFILVKTLVENSYSSKLTFQYVGLDEPEKKAVLSWESNGANSTPPPRRALVHARFETKTLEIVVDLSTCSIASKQEYTGKGFPMLTVEEQSQACALSSKHKALVESVKERGLDIDYVFCSTFTVGWYGEINPKRVMKVQCFYANGTANLYVRPLEGILLVVDLDEMRVVEYHDRFRVPMPKAEGTEFVESNLKPPFGPRLNNGVLVVSPNGAGFKMNGHVIR